MKAVAIKGMNLLNAIAEAQAKQEQEFERVKAMSPAEFDQYVIEQEAKAVETEKILKQLRGPGFMEMRLG